LDGTACELDESWAEHQPSLRGYLVGDRFVADDARVDPDPTKLIQQTVQVFCVERGLGRFTRAAVIRDREERFIYLRQEFPMGPELDVLAAFQDRKESVAHVKCVTPSLELAFLWITHQRELAEERRRELERIRAEEEAAREAEEKLQRAMRDAGTAVGRRALATRDFEMAAREALRVSNSELLDVRDSFRKGEKVVQYRFRQRRLECVVDAKTLRIVDAGVCLDDHAGTKGDSLFTLESLPGVIGEAMDQRKLVVWRHVDEEEDQW
jgi:hypothetical protein